MALFYRTEYRIGNRGRICRSYTGFAAFGAIFFDLGFGLVFELMTAVIGLSARLVFMTLRLGIVVLRKSWCALFGVLAVVFALLTFPFLVVHDWVIRFRSRIAAGRGHFYPRAAVKPDWAMNREV